MNKNKTSKSLDVQTKGLLTETKLPEGENHSQEYKEQINNPYSIDKIKYYLWQQFHYEYDNNSAKYDKEKWGNFYNEEWLKYCDYNEIKNGEKAKILADLFTENEYLRRAKRAYVKLNDGSLLNEDKEKYEKKIQENIGLLKAFYKDKGKNEVNPKNQKDVSTLFEQSENKIAKFNKENIEDIQTESNKIKDGKILNHIRFAGIVTNIETSINHAKVHQNMYHEMKDNQMKKHARRFIWAQSLKTEDVMKLPENLQIKYAYYKYFFLEKMRMQCKEQDEDFAFFINTLYSNVKDYKPKDKHKKKMEYGRESALEVLEQLKQEAAALEKKEQEAARLKAELEVTRLKAERDALEAQAALEAARDAEQKKAEREAREKEAQLKAEREAAIKIQKLARGYKARTQVNKLKEEQEKIKAELEEARLKAEQLKAALEAEQKKAEREEKARAEQEEARKAQAEREEVRERLKQLKKEQDNLEALHNEYQKIMKESPQEIPENLKEETVSKALEEIEERLKKVKGFAEGKTKDGDPKEILDNIDKELIKFDKELQENIKQEFEKQKDNISNLLSEVLSKRLENEISDGNLTEEQKKNRTKWVDFINKVKKHIEEKAMTSDQHRAFLAAQQAIADGFSKWAQSKDGGNKMSINDQSIKKMLNIKTKENEENINYIITHNLNKNSGYWRGGTLFNLEKAMPELVSIDMALIYKKQLEKRIQDNVEPIKEKYADRGNNGRLPDGWHNLQERKKASKDLDCELKKKLKEVDNTIAKYYSENRRPSTGHSHNNQRGMSRNYSYRSGISASYSRASVRQNNNRFRIRENDKSMTDSNFYPQQQNKKYGDQTKENVFNRTEYKKDIFEKEREVKKNQKQI